jgi:hypothetical protein
MKSVIGVSALSIITILGKSLASKSKPTYYDGGSLFDGFIPNYDNDTNPLAKTGYDDVSNDQRKIVYKLRDELMDANNVQDRIITNLPQALGYS